jgi:BirA family biotin operon repressor/biotin-[acetyl-CoA-carboxylase] ligase
MNVIFDRLLTHMRRRPMRFFSLNELAKRHHCEKSDIIVAVELLRQSGYEIKADRRGRYAFVAAPDLLLAAEISHGLKTAVIGRTIYAYQSVQSTNSIAAQLADVKAPEGSIVVAESQTKGRGRLGRIWHSPDRVGIYLSIILYPRIDPAMAPGLSVMTAQSLAETIADYDAVDVRVKWPNDCLINGRKVAGILTELSAEVGRVRYVIVGIGINVNHRRRDFPPDIARFATSLRAELKETMPRVEFLQRFLRHFENDYRRFQKAGLKPLRKRIIRYSSLIGRKVRLDMKDRIILGTAVDIDDRGRLVLDTPEGVRAYGAGEVTLLRKR